jgi:hypothetical protein
MIEHSNYWTLFSTSLKDRLRKPLRHPTFVMYFFVFIVFIGGIGVLEPIATYILSGQFPSRDLYHVIVCEIYTYFIAISATVTIDLILSTDKHKFLVMFFIVCLVGILVCFAFSVIYAQFLNRPRAALIPAALGYLLALFLWWIGNADNSKLLEKPVKPLDAIGDDTGLSGDLGGYVS